jgi:hypothetical protein
VIPLDTAPEARRPGEISHGEGGVIDADFEESTNPGAATEQPPAAEGSASKRAIGFKEFLRSMPDAGDDADFERPVGEPIAVRENHR